ncbi:uncharacterized protein NPIL_638591 [Nephila pilipes]|uniref:Uncharacterized protein n=1 Tax=Nephila pilipes TaxID=299642 RepID=A0A8X6P2B3_NEPPI|nr:uncharacterized protein NPIL_638591 [Nephila pilipes]
MFGRENIKSKSQSSFTSVAASASSKDSETKTIYTNDLDGERIRVLVDGVLRVTIFKGVSDDSYRTNWTSSVPQKTQQLCSSTVIDANGSQIETIRICDGEEESISVHKDHILLCKVSNSVH